MITSPMDSNKKITANQYAKYWVHDRGEAAGYDPEWQTGLEKATEKEINDVLKYVSIHQERVREFLGIDKFI